MWNHIIKSGTLERRAKLRSTFHCLVMLASDSLPVNSNYKLKQKV
jgi:hypothetical protein